MQSHQMAFVAGVPVWATWRHYYLVPHSLPSPAPDGGPQSAGTQHSWRGCKLLKSHQGARGASVLGRLQVCAPELETKLPRTSWLESPLSGRPTLTTPSTSVHAPSPSHQPPPVPGTASALSFTNHTSPAPHMQPGLQETLKGHWLDSRLNKEWDTTN